MIRITFPKKKSKRPRTEAINRKPLTGQTVAEAREMNLRISYLYNQDNAIPRPPLP